MDWPGVGERGRTPAHHPSRSHLSHPFLSSSAPASISPTGAAQRAPLRPQGPLSVGRLLAARRPRPRGCPADGPRLAHAPPQQHARSPARHQRRCRCRRCSTVAGPSAALAHALRPHASHRSGNSHCRRRCAVTTPPPPRRGHTCLCRLRRRHRHHPDTFGSCTPAATAGLDVGNPPAHRRRGRLRCFCRCCRRRRIRRAAPSTAHQARACRPHNRCRRDAVPRGGPAANWHDISRRHNAAPTAASSAATAAACLRRSCGRAARLCERGRV